MLLNMEWSWVQRSLCKSIQIPHQHSEFNIRWSDIKPGTSNTTDSHLKFFWNKKYLYHLNIIRELKWSVNKHDPTLTYPILSLSNCSPVNMSALQVEVFLLLVILAETISVNHSYLFCTKQKPHQSAINKFGSWRRQPYSHPLFILIIFYPFLLFLIFVTEIIFIFRHNEARSRNPFTIFSQAEAHSK